MVADQESPTPRVDLALLQAQHRTSRSSPHRDDPTTEADTEDLDEFYTDLLYEGKLNGAGGGLAPKTVRYIHATIRKGLHDAQRKGTLVRNVADLADPPKISAGRGKLMQVWNPAQLREFLDIAATHELFPGFWIAANTGMRRGEVLGLRWRNVDLDNGRLVVMEAVQSVSYDKSVTDVKTNSSRRTIDLDRRTVSVLRAWRTAFDERDRQTGRKQNNDDFVVGRYDGSPHHPDFFSQTFHRLVAGSQLPKIRLHDLRHTHASILLQAGVPVKVVSERLGHSSPAFTIIVYQHVMPGMQAEAAAKFSDAVFGEDEEDETEEE